MYIFRYKLFIGYETGCSQPLLFDGTGATRAGVRLSARSTKSGTTLEGAAMEGDVTCPDSRKWQAGSTDSDQWYQVGHQQPRHVFGRCFAIRQAIRQCIVTATTTI